MIYLDASALLKLVVAEAESGALGRFLVPGEDRLATSVIGEIETIRGARRYGRTERATAVLAGVRRVSLAREIVELAGTIEPAQLRALDAVHLATALVLRDDVEAFVAYDRRLLLAAEAAELPIVAPA